MTIMKTPKKSMKRKKSVAETLKQSRPISLIVCCDLPEMSKEAASDAFESARIAKKLHVPLDLREAWESEYSRQWTIDNFLRMMKDIVKSKQLNDPAEAPFRIARLFEAMTHVFENMVKSGVLDQALPHLGALPILYSPKAGGGATDWVRAKDLYIKKGIGTQALCKSRGLTFDTSRTPVWAELAETVVRVINQARLELSPAADTPNACGALIDRAVAWGEYTKSRSKRAKKVRGRMFRLDDGGVLLWHSWLDDCTDLPGKVSEGRKSYLAVARKVVDDFFALPNNPRADDIVTYVTGVRTELPRPSAVGEARKSILKAIRSM